MARPTTVPIPSIPALVLDVDIEGEIDMSEFNAAPLASALRRAGWRASAMIKTTWIAVAQGLHVRESGRYIAGITANGNATVETRVAGEQAKSVEMMLQIENVAPHASYVEDGHGAFSLPDSIDWNGPNVKRGKGGNRFLHIPFGHTAYASPSQREAKGYTRSSIRRMMPHDIYDRARDMGFTRRMNAGRQYAEDGRYLARDRYEKREDPRKPSPQAFRMGHDAKVGKRRKIDPGRGGGMTVDVRRRARIVGYTADGKELRNPDWQYSKYDGLMRTGRPRHEGYMTIRTITPDSEGFRIPAVEGKHIVRNIMREIEGGPLGEAITDIIVREIAEALGMEGDE